MIVKVFRTILNLLLSFILKNVNFLARIIFITNCIVGKNFRCKYKSKCINNTGIKERIQIGNNCEILGMLRVEHNGQISIGDNTTIRYDTRVFSINKIQIGNAVIISNNVTIYDNNNHPIDPNKRIQMSMSGFYGELWQAKHSASAPIIINDNVWIGERSTILKGVTIGKGAIIAMGTIVTRDVPEYSVVAGNPGKVVKFIK